MSPAHMASLQCASHRRDAGVRAGTFGKGRPEEPEVPRSYGSALAAATLRSRAEARLAMREHAARAEKERKKEKAG